MSVSHELAGWWEAMGASITEKLIRRVKVPAEIDSFATDALVPGDM